LTGGSVHQRTAGLDQKPDHTSKMLWLIILPFLLMAACTGNENSFAEPQIEPTLGPAGASILPANFDVQGHRGARGLKPENTLPAFEAALDLGVTTLELDLHFTADGDLIIWHDPEIDSSKCGLDPAATIEAPNPDSLIYQGEKLMFRNLTSAQLEAYRCDRNPDSDAYPNQNGEPTVLAGDDYGLISLRELFDFVEAYSQSEEKSVAQRENADRVQFNIETKRRPESPGFINDGFDGINPGPFELAILALVEEKGLKDRVIIQSFDHRSLWAIRAVNDPIRLSALTRSSETEPPLATLAERGANIWSPNYRAVTADLINQAHEAGLLVMPYTVNDPADMRRLITLGVDGIITDRPDLLMSLR